MVQTDFGGAAGLDPLRLVDQGPGQTSPHAHAPGLGLRTACFGEPIGYGANRLEGIISTRPPAARLFSIPTTTKNIAGFSHTLTPAISYFQADDCDEYFLLGLRNPAEVSFVTDSIYTRPEQVQNAVEMLEKHRVQFVMWSAWLDVPRSPGADGSAEAPLRVYLACSLPSGERI